MVKKKSAEEIANNIQEQLDVLKRELKGDPKETHAILALDVSGSMASCQKETTDGINEYLNTLRADKENKFRVSLLEFDSGRTDWVWECKPLEEIESFKGFLPGGMTPLYDGIGAAIQFAETVQDKFNTVLVISTDGGENSSRKFSVSQIKEMITNKQDGHDWTVIYTGANQDAFSVGNQIGASVSFNYDTNNSAMAFASMGSSVSASSSGYASGQNLGQRVNAVKVARARVYDTPKVDKDTPVV